MFDGLNNNRSHWNEQAEVYMAKMKAIEDQKKKLEDDENKKGKKEIQIHRSVYICTVDGLIEDQVFSVKNHPMPIHPFYFCVHPGDGKSKTCTIC